MCMASSLVFLHVPSRKRARLKRAMAPLLQAARVSMLTGERHGVRQSDPDAGVPEKCRLCARQGRSTPIENAKMPGVDEKRCSTLEPVPDEKFEAPDEVSRMLARLHFENVVAACVRYAPQ